MKIKNIMCPVDFSTTSQAAIPQASTLAGKYGASLHFVHVYEAVFATPTWDGLPVEPMPADLDLFEAKLAAIQPTSNSIEYRHKLLHGFPASSLLQYAESHNIDLIVMATHGLTGLSRVLMGSVAESIVRKATTPVLVVHTQDAVVPV